MNTTASNGPPVTDVAVPLPFEAFVRAHRERLLRLAVLITRNWPDAHDAVQDALAGLHRRWPAVPEEAARREAYARRCVVNSSLDILKRRRSVPVADPEQLSLAPVAADHAQAIADADTAWRLCATLPPVQRAAVVLRFYADLGYAEIAATLGCREATARSHVQRALTALRARLPEEELR